MKLKKLLGALGCLLSLVAAGFMAWRYGPWSNKDDDEAANRKFEALGACDGCCNGLESNCALPINEVTFAMVHNAMSSRDDLFAAYNNVRPLEDALVAGYRGLMLDSCICEGNVGEKIANFFKGEDDLGSNYLGFCHATCSAGMRSPSEVLGNIKTFLKTNRNEVLILEFEVINNSLDKLYAALGESGLDEYIYIVNSSVWPTMQSLIDADFRLLLFAHGDGIDASCSKIDCPKGISYTYDHFQETDWNDDTCDVKGSNGYRDNMGFFLMNHWKNNKESDLPSKNNAEEFNTFDTLAQRVDKCEQGMPNIIAVDFWDTGDVLELVAQANGKNATG